MTETPTFEAPEVDAARVALKEQRKATALRRVMDALTQQSEARLSDVFYDANEDGDEELDYEAEIPRVVGHSDHGFDSDDLAALLLPVLTAAFRVHVADEQREP